jgi:hypothetical protein
MTAAIPPVHSATGFLNILHDMESGETSAGSPRGREKSNRRDDPEFKKSSAAASSDRATMRGSRMIESMHRV